MLASPMVAPASSSSVSASSSSDQSTAQEAIELESTRNKAGDIEQQLPLSEAQGSSSHDWGSDRWDWPTNSKSDKYDPCPAARVCCYQRRVGNYYVHYHGGDESGRTHSSLSRGFG
eukprot:TRINITY_DN4958_c0_g2_i1.p1 TRINITY_DN4958_c0_g2~~TRINITY_DN4958_c0_g2_i1.p1  ORF type:complete len:116 (-),score=18.94 TRINITY_DN4958_c0_g2_i1:164-511(-)